MIRVENTVRRPVGPRANYIHSLLKILEEKGYNPAPRFLGIDTQGREILTFIEGDVPHGEFIWSDEQLIEAVKILRRFHDATAGSLLAEESEVVCHNDFAPWNIVIRNEMPVGIIDFDDATPGSRVDDLAYFLWTFLDLGSPVSPEIQAEKINRICRAYGFSDGNLLVNAILEQQKKILLKRKGLAQNAVTKEAREFSASRIDKIRSEIEWVEKNRSILEKI